MLTSIQLGYRYGLRLGETFAITWQDINFKKDFINKNINYHSLRHTHATMLLNSGVNIKAVQERLGHKKLDMTLNVYSHVTESMREQTLHVLNNNTKIKSN